MMLTMMLTIPFGTVFLVSIDEAVIKILMSYLVNIFCNFDRQVAGELKPLLLDMFSF